MRVILHNGSQPACHIVSPQPPLAPVLTMATKSPQLKGRDRAVSTLNVLIQVLNLAKDTCGVPPAQVAFGSAVVLLTLIKASPPLLQPGAPK